MDNEKDTEKKGDTQPKDVAPKNDESKPEGSKKDSGTDLKTDPKKEPVTETKPVSPEILDLAEKVAGDPKSRLFVHLAEEYLKIELVEEALLVLNEGLKAHPNFLSAKVMLGRAKLEKGDVAEAKSIFEEVAAVHPDNLLVQRKLAVIYKDEGQLETAKRACQAVLALNPKDEEMLSVSKAVEEMEKARGGPVGVPGSVDEAPEMVVEQTSHKEGSAPHKPSSETPGSGDASDRPAAREIAQEPLLETTTVVKPGLPGGKPSDTPAGQLETPQTGTPGTGTPGTETPGAETLKTDTSKVLGSSLRSPDGSKGNMEVQQEPLLETNTFSEAGPAEPAGEKPLEEMNSEALAGLYINQGHIEKGVAIFRKLLAENPGNKTLHKKLEEAVQKIRAKSAPGPSQAPVPSSDPKGSTPSSPPVESGSKGEENSKNTERVKRLQSWLESIKKGQKE